MDIARNIGAVLLGMVVGMALNMGFVLLNVAIFPLPEGVDMTDAEQMKVAIAAMPAAAWILVFVAHFSQAGVGGWVAARVGATRPLVLALVVGALSTLGGIQNSLQLEVPWWVWAETPFYLVFAYLAGSLEARRRAAN